jgi:hypothetical protein
MSKIKLIYDNNCTWEKDYIKELFSLIEYDLIYVDLNNLINRLHDEEQYINDKTFMILVFSSNVYRYCDILKIVLRIKPIIIVHLSDEWGNRPQYTDLAAHTKLLLHQYCQKNYDYNKYNNIIQIPLGYMTGMFNNKISKDLTLGDKNFALNIKLKPISERKYKWTFIGRIKQDRRIILFKFSRKIKEKFYGKNIKPSNMFDVYNDSIFIPNGRGNFTLDCFRIYEAILSGCIPVIVGKNDELDTIFYYNNDKPPFIIEKTWDNAINKCMYLLDNIKELENVQQQNYKWLENKIKSIQKLIKDTLTN